MLKIILVENHEDTRAFLETYLTSVGHRVAGAHSLAAAKDILANESTDILICDIGLPDGDGRNLLRGLPNSKRPRLSIAMSGRGGADDMRSSLSAGFHHHLVKPFLPEELDRLLMSVTKS